MAILWQAENFLYLAIFYISPSFLGLETNLGKPSPTRGYKKCPKVYSSNLWFHFSYVKSDLLQIWL